jgi:hypothetical protein
MAMADRVIHISETEAAGNFADLLARVRAGAKVMIESERGKLPVAVIHAPAPLHRTISECIALLPEDSTAVMDADFVKDIEAAIESHREPLTPPTWGLILDSSVLITAERQGQNARHMLAAICDQTGNRCFCNQTDRTRLRCSPRRHGLKSGEPLEVGAKAGEM